MELIRDNRVLLARAPAGATETFQYRDTATGPETSFYYVRVVQSNGLIAWSSPIWVRRK